MRFPLIVSLGVAALAACRTAGTEGQSALKEAPVLEAEPAGPSGPINCGSLDLGYNRDRGVGPFCWGDGADANSRCYVAEHDGSFTDAACDDESLQACAGGLGSGCGLHGSGTELADLPCQAGDDPERPWMMKCIVAVGSILHDACCAEKNMQGIEASGCMGAWGVVPGRACDDFWQEAIFDRARGFYWWVTFDTRKRFRSDDTWSRGIDTPFLMSKFGIKAPSGQQLGGMRYGLVPNPADAALSVIFSRRTGEDWGQFCQTREVASTWKNWAKGVAVCK